MGIGGEEWSKMVGELDRRDGRLGIRDKKG